MSRPLSVLYSMPSKEKYVTEGAHTDKYSASVPRVGDRSKGGKGLNMRMLKSYQPSSLITNGCSLKSFVTLNVLSDVMASPVKRYQYQVIKCPPLDHHQRMIWPVLKKGRIRRKISLRPGRMMHNEYVCIIYVSLNLC